MDCCLKIGRGYSQIQYLQIKTTSLIQYLQIKTTSQIQYLQIKNQVTDTVSANKNYVTDTVSANKNYVTDTVSVRNNQKYTRLYNSIQSDTCICTIICNHVLPITTSLKQCTWLYDVKKIVIQCTRLQNSVQFRSRGWRSSLPGLRTRDPPLSPPST